MVKLARDEQCITLFPLTAHYTVGPFPAHVIFRPSQGPFILGLISSICLLTARYMPFLLVGQIQPVDTVGPLIRLGNFHTITKYGLLTARYGQPIKRTISTLVRLRPLIRPVQGP